MKEIWY